MRQHESVVLPSGVIRCMHCGAAWADNMGVTCIDRPGLDPEPMRAWHGSALDDIDALHTRIIELRKERTPVQVFDELDLGCG